MPKESTDNLPKTERVCVIVPTYNNGGTVGEVLRGILRHTPDVIVVVDGSTDDTLRRIEELPPLRAVVAYERNRGKGHALRKGFAEAVRLGFDYAITIDADGQHYPDDIPLFIDAVARHPGSLIVGSRNLKSENMPGKSTFANRFSNFWFYVQTGRQLADTQTGYRLYPLRRLAGLSGITSRYEAELALLVFAAWHGVPLISVPVRVYYPPAEERVSHFRPGMDFFRISLLNTVLCIGAVFYGLPLRIYRMFNRCIRR